MHRTPSETPGHVLSRDRPQTVGPASQFRLFRGRFPVVSCYTIRVMDPAVPDPYDRTGDPGMPGSPPDAGQWVVTDGRSPLPWVLAVAGILAVLGVGALFLLRGDGEAEDRVETDAPSGFEQGPERAGGLAPAPTGELSGEPTGEPSEASTPSPEMPPVGNLILESALPAFRSLEEAVGQPYRTRSFAIYPTYAFLEFRDPENAAHIDELTWRDGRVEGPEPVALSGSEDIESELFTLGDVNLDAIPALARRALDEFALEDGEVTHVIVDRFFGADGRVTMRVYVSDPERGGGGYLLAGADGTYMRTTG